MKQHALSPVAINMRACDRK